jgi:hypothetical protein
MNFELGTRTIKNEDELGILNNPKSIIQNLKLNKMTAKYLTNRLFNSPPLEGAGGGYIRNFEQSII